MTRNRSIQLVAAATVAVALSASSAYAQKKYDTGASDTEIKIGQTMPFSGAYSVYASIGKTQAAYMKMINEQGGINGRKVNLIQYDDAYSPPKTVEQIRKLVESDEVLLTFQIIGTAANAARCALAIRERIEDDTVVLATAVFRITQPGSYYLTGNVNGPSGFNAIEIASVDVTIDLMGYAVLGVAGSLTGIDSTINASNLTIRNGTVRGWGSGGTNIAVSSFEHNRLIEHIRASSNGGAGISAGRRAILRARSTKSRAL